MPPSSTPPSTIRRCVRNSKALVGLLAPFGASNSLAAKLIQLTMPGVPDVYQGTEFWDRSLTDPDNRRPFSFDERVRALEQLDAGHLPDSFEDEAAKLLVTSRALRLRRDRPELFTGYRPVQAGGPAAGHLLAFDRGPGECWRLQRGFPTGCSSRAGGGTPPSSLKPP